MELERLVLQRFRVERIEGRMVATLDPKGNYKAHQAEDVERALTQLIVPRNLLVEVRIGKKWHRIQRRVK